ncbi:MAG: hypothetical protein AB1410_04125 [Acidobacteriota bacterium]
MNKWILVFFVIFTFFLLQSPLVFSQESKAPLKDEIVKLKYIKPTDAINLLRVYRSKEGNISFNQALRIISIRDHPEIVEKMLDVLKEIDVKPVDLQFNVQLILGSEKEEEKMDEALKNDPVIKEIKSLLRYKAFKVLDTSFIRGNDRGSSLLTLGGADNEFKLILTPKYIKEEKEEIIQMEINLAKIKVTVAKTGLVGAPPEERRDSITLLNTNLTIKPGERTVVGVSRMDGGDKGLILIISGKVLR